MNNNHQKEDHGEHPLNHKGQITFLGLFVAVWVMDSFIFRRSTYLFSYFPIWFRLILLFFSIVMVIYLFKSVILAFSNDSGKVVATGPFKYVRHPMYLAMILLYAGLSLSTMSLFSMLLVLPIFVFYNHIAIYEEKFLTKRFGKQYTNYKKSANRWLPKL